MIREGLTFDDVLLVPKYSLITSRADVDISVKYGNLQLSHPIIPANMQTVTGQAMAIANSKSGGLSILHRFMPFKDQLSIADTMISEWGAQDRFGVSVGVKDDDKDCVTSFANMGVKIVCIDIAHGDSWHCVDMVRWIRDKYPKMCIIAGNVATGQGAGRLWQAGADIVKVGVGPGSLCTTRIETGNGVPQLTALMDVSKVQESLRTINPQMKYPFISDGGIKNAGDIVKALCFADMVMAGNLFAGCVETPGQVMSIDGRTFKEYVGSSTHKTNHVEGVAAIVPTKGRYIDVLDKLLEGLRSGCSYQGSNSLEELRDNPEFIRITGAGLKESHPHDVILR